jgi:hypothetical protein
MLEDYMKPPKAEKKDPAHEAAGSFVYRFKDGSRLRLVKGEKVSIDGPRLKELKKYKHVREVK